MRVDDDVVALDATMKAHVISSTGALLWPLLDGSASIEELALDVADVFGIDPATARADVSRFVESMVDLGLVGVTSHDEP